MSGPVTSFVRKSKGRSNIPKIPGTRPSLTNNLLLTSCGVPSIDHFIGSVPVGTILLIDEDFFGSYAKLLVKYFIAEGVVVGHPVLLASAPELPETILQELPAPIEYRETPSTSAADTSDLKIAWRYSQGNQQKEGPLLENQFGHNFDLRKRISTTLMEKASVVTVSQSPCDSFYSHLYQKISTFLSDGGVVSSSSPPSSVVRIAIKGLGSPLWMNQISPESSNSEIVRFLYKLRSLLRSASATCIITVPSNIIENSLMSKLHHFCDTVIKLESFAGSDKEVNSLFSNYHGLFHIQKLSILNSLKASQQITPDLAFKVTKTKFSVEKLHLPPEQFDEPVQQSFCSSKRPGGQSLDF